MTKVVNPHKGKDRERRVSQEEIDKLMKASWYTPGAVPETQMEKTMHAFLFALETGARTGEICRIRPEDVFLEERYVRLDQTWDRPAHITKAAANKNGDARNASLTSTAVALLKTCDTPSRGRVFGLTNKECSALFAKICKKAKITDLHFHDSRHEAITRLAEKLDLPELAKTVGVRDWKTLNIYYNKHATDIARKLH